jgi:hypothetical protein
MSLENNLNHMDQDQAVEEISRILRDLRSPDEMLVSADKWITSALYEQYSRDEPQSAPYQILKSIFKDILNEIEEDNPEYASILRDRFWKGLTAKEIALNSPWSERTYFSLQNKAIKLFSFLLLQKEQTCRAVLIHHTDSSSPPIAKSKVSKMTTANRNNLFSGHFLYGSIVIILFGGLFAALLFFTNNYFGEKTPLGQIAEIAGQEYEKVGTVTSGGSLGITPEVFRSKAFCGEAERMVMPPTNRFVRSEGISLFTVENSEGAVLSDSVRTLSNSPEGLWIGYFSNQSQRGGIGNYDKESWSECLGSGLVKGEKVNIVLADDFQRVWVGYEKHGIAMFEGGRWVHVSTEEGLPSVYIYSITVDKEGVVWAGTWEGIAKYDGSDWTVPYTVKNETIYSDRVHAVAFDSSSNIWVGHITNGVSQYEYSSGKWVHHTAERTGLSGNNIRHILVKPETPGQSESVWFATSDGGISIYERGAWNFYDISNGLPSNDVRALALDRYGRVWAATGAGVVYLHDSEEWVIYHNLNTSSIAIGTGCEGCVFDDDVVWTGTVEKGLTHSRLPLPEPVLEVSSICFVDDQRERVCPELVPEISANKLVISAEYPGVLIAGDILRFEVTVVPRPPYQLRDDRGDFLSNSDSDDFNLFGAWPIVPVGEVIEPGQPYTFTDYDNPFIVPEISGEKEQFTSTWRVWMHTRYAGPEVRLIFTVSR